MSPVSGKSAYEQRRIWEDLPCKMAELLNKFIRDLEDSEASELDNYCRFYLNSSMGKHRSGLNMDKLKIILWLYGTGITDFECGQILSYLENLQFGWRDNTYILDNHCLRYKGTNHCKSISKVDSVEIATDNFFTLSKLFFQGEYGEKMLYLFCYCIASLFNSKLQQERFSVPFYLQIACEKNSVLYHVIQEFVAICDINEGIFDLCNDSCHKYGCCGYTHKTFYPVQSIAECMDTLSFFRDIPAIIDGYDNERYYNALLREIANTPNKTKPTETRLNIMPVFVCPAITSEFNNVFSMDLSDLDVGSNYLNLLRKNKKMLASWILELVSDYKRYLFPSTNEDDPQQMYSVSADIRNYTVSHIRSKYPDFTLENARNVGMLSFFFKGFMKVFKGSFSFPLEHEFAVIKRNDKPLSQDGEKNVNSFTRCAETYLIRLHRHYLPAPKSMGFGDKNALLLAKRIEKEYRKFKVHIRVTPEKSANERFILNVDLLQNTTELDIKKCSNTVQRNLKYELFQVHLNDPTKITIIAAKETPKENSLINLLDSSQFTDAKKKIPYAMGHDDIGTAYVEDVAELPHLLLAGATGSGKTTAIMCLITSILYKNQKGEANLLILDLLGKQKSDYEVFADHKSLSYPIVSDIHTAFQVVLCLEKEMEQRLKNKDVDSLPYIICIIDEFPNLFSKLDKKSDFRRLDKAITLLLSQGRHARIHMILSAQNPIKKHMVSGTSNITARIAFRCSNIHHSIAVIGRKDATQLYGKGQMIFDSADKSGERLRGAYIDKPAIKELLDNLTFRQDNKFPFRLNEADLLQDDISLEDGSSRTIAATTYKAPTFDENLLDIIKLLREKGKISNADVIKHLEVGYPKAKLYMQRLEELSLIPPLNGKRKARLLNPDYLIDKDAIARLKDKVP